MALSEYGCDALNWHTSNPEPGDYSEEYQTVFHENVIQQMRERPFVWATFVWNMFDFAADARTEGGEDGINHMGLVTFDRKYKKDAFYAYKAWLSNEPFVHICGKRYVDRLEPVTKITVYSNQKEVSLFVDGNLLDRQTGGNGFFRFNVPNKGKHVVVARAGDYEDTSIIRKVEAFNEEYLLKEKGDIINWFEITSPEGYFSINDKLEEIAANKRAMRVVGFTVAKVSIRKRLKVGKTTEPKDKSRKIDLSNQEMKDFLYGMSVKRLISMAGTMGPKLEFQKRDVLKLNQKLNKIKKQGDKHYGEGNTAFRHKG